MQIYAMLLCSLISAGASAGVRSSIDMDGQWTFRMDPQNLGETERWFGAPVAFPDTIRVPGAWDAQGFGNETDKVHHQFLGKAWYKRQVDVPTDWVGRRVFLRFGGAHRYAAVWLNDKLLGEHAGFSSFEFDITEYATPGTSALIAVRVDSEQRWDIDTLIGAWDIIDYMYTYWGGLWGHVALEARSPVHLQNLFIEPAVAPPRCRVSATVAGTPPDGAALHLDILDIAGTVVAQKDAPSDAPLIPLQIEVPDAKLWTPDTPNLYWARLSIVKDGNPIDAVETRFGFRQISVDGVRLLLNGQPFFLRGYGDDAIYPETMAAPSDEAVYRKKIQIAKEYGFNHVRHHSHFLPPEYYDVCDELGMLVSPELPIGYQQFYNKAQGPALELYKTEWASAIRRFRNHPSILDWCMGNEMYESVPIAPELYRVAKELDTTRPVVDTDGLPAAGFTEGTRDRDTLDVYFTQFDVFSSPLDKPKLYDCPAPKKPVISHETGNYVTFPRLDQIDLFKDNFKPFWLLEARDKVQRMGLLDETPLWAANTEKLYTLLRKLDIETLRNSPNISGYHWWLLQDYWTTSNGIIDTYFRCKPDVARDAIRQFNNDVVLLQDGVNSAYCGGTHIQAALLVSNFGTAPLSAPVLSYTVSSDTTQLAEQSLSAPSAPQGTLTRLAAIDIPLPAVDVPTRLLLKARLTSGTAVFTNEWSTWVYPLPTRAPHVPVFGAAELLPWLKDYAIQPLPSDKPYPVQALYLSNQLTPELLDAALAGAALLLYKPLGLLASAPTRFKTAWWLGSAEDNNAGTVVYDFPVVRAMAPEGWCDASWYSLLEGCDGYLLDELLARPEVLVRGVEVACVCRNKSMLFQASVGKGSVIVCGLNLDASAQDGTPSPAAQCLTTRLLEYAATLPHPAATLPEAFLRQRAVDVPQMTGPFVEGFARLLKNEGESTTWFTCRKQSDRTECLRQKEVGPAIEWETAIIPAVLNSDTVTFVFAGGLGWVSQPATEGFALSLDGKDILHFDVCRGRGTWRDDTNNVTLTLTPRRMTSEDTAGLFYVAVPRAFVTPGQPCRLAVRSLGAGSQRWFALHPYTDILTTQRIRAGQ